MLETTWVSCPKRHRCPLRHVVGVASYIINRLIYLNSLNRPRKGDLKIFWGMGKLRNRTFADDQVSNLSTRSTHLVASGIEPSQPARGEIPTSSGRRRARLRPANRVDGVSILKNTVWCEKSPGFSHERSGLVEPDYQHLFALQRVPKC